MRKHILGGVLFFAAAFASAAELAADALSTDLASGEAAASYKVLRRFAGPDGTSPRAHLIQATDGNFYGTTELGGTLGKGTVFRMTPAGAITTLHNFGSNTDGKRPRAALLQGKDGRLYGTTAEGGSFNLGTVFRLSTSGSGYVMLYHFRGRTYEDGDMPLAGLMQASDGYLYGMTQYGGTYDSGTAYRLSTSGSSYKVLHSFGASAHGEYPTFAHFIQLADGKLYATTRDGGNYGYGTVFKMTTAGTVTLVHALSSRAGQGAYPTSGVVLGKDGMLYALAEMGGVNDGGVAFKVKPDGTGFKKIHDFAAWDMPLGLIQASNGLFYGTTYGGGSIGAGQAFRMTTAGAVTIMHDFVGGTDGYWAQGKPIQGSDGYLYGTTVSGGAAVGSNVGGTVYRFSMN